MKQLISIILLHTAISCCSAQIKPILSGVYTWDKTRAVPAEGKEAILIAEGSTPELSWFKIEGILLQKGAALKPVIQDSIEQLIILKEGSVALSIGGSRETLTAGSVALIPPKTSLQISNAESNIASYYALQYKSVKPIQLQRMGSKTAIVVHADTVSCTEKNGKGRCAYFEQPTALCENYEMHITKLSKKGPSHAGHRHIDTEIILVTAGKAFMDIDGQVYKGGAGDLFIATPNTLHQVGNAEETACTYFAFKWR